MDLESIRFYNFYNRLETLFGFFLFVFLFLFLTIIAACVRSFVSHLVKWTLRFFVALNLLLAVVEEPATLSAALSPLVTIPIEILSTFCELDSKTQR